MSSLQRPVLLLEVSTHRGLSGSWTCLYFRGLCCSWRCLHHRGRAASNVSALQRPVLLLKVSTPHGLERHLNVSALQRPVLLLEVSTPQGLELHLNVSAQQRLVLLLKVSTPQGTSCIWTCLHYRHVPTYCRKFSLRFENNVLNVGHVRFASKIIFFLFNVFATLRK